MIHYQKCNIIAEIGCTHIGDLKRAKMLARLAKLAGADVIKLQKRNPKESTPISLQKAPHPNKHFSYGNTYLEHRENIELNIQQHTELQKYCQDIDIIYSTSVWDLTSAKEIISLNPKMIKIPSALNRNIKLIEYLYHNYNGQIHISLGMTTKQERIDLLNYLTNNQLKRTVIYHCVSGYPVPFQKQYILEINNLIKIKNKNKPFEIGYSGHGYGIATDIAAYTLGATWVERHFIDDRTFRHTDASASLEPEGLRKLCRDLAAIQQTMQYKPNDIDNIELEQRQKLSK